MTWTILIFAVFTGLCAFAQGYWDLLFYRTIAGLGTSAASSASAWRWWRERGLPAAARASSYVGLGWHGRRAPAGLATVFLKPVIGWRGMFLGLIPCGRVLLHPPHGRRAGGLYREDPRLEERAADPAWLVKDARRRTLLGMFIPLPVQNLAITAS